MFIRFIGTEIVISSKPSCKDENARLTTVLMKRFFLNNVEDIVVFFLSLKVLNFDNDPICFPAEEMRRSVL